MEDPSNCKSDRPCSGYLTMSQSENSPPSAKAFFRPAAPHSRPAESTKFIRWEISTKGLMSMFLWNRALSQFRSPRIFFGRLTSSVSPFDSPPIQRSRRNSICLFRDLCSRSASSVSFSFNFCGMRRSTRTRNWLIDLDALSTI
jgi:hypothetical protein